MIHRPRDNTDINRNLSFFFIRILIDEFGQLVLLHHDLSHTIIHMLTTRPFEMMAPWLDPRNQWANGWIAHGDHLGTFWIESANLFSQIITIRTLSFFSKRPKLYNHPSALWRITAKLITGWVQIGSMTFPCHDYSESNCCQWIPSYRTNDTKWAPTNAANGIKDTMTWNTWWIQVYLGLRGKEMPETSS